MSTADIIYSHINGKDIQTIETTSKEVTVRYVEKTKSVSLDSVIRGKDDN